MAHPLDPLSAAEIRAAAGAVRAAHPELERPAFAVVALEDPLKSVVVEGGEASRHARLVVLERGTGTTYEAIVVLGLDEPRVDSWAVVAHVQPPIMPDEMALAAQLARADPRFQAALARRGIDDPEQVQVDPLAAGFYDHHPAGRRILWATPYLKAHADDNPYARPIENVRACVDLIHQEVLEVVDGDVVAFPDVPTRHAETPADLAPLHITQPDGPGFTLDGHELEWQAWRLHVALHPIDGLVLSHIRLHDRSVVYRAALSEMVVPYGDPHDGYYWRSYFDAGEYGMGRTSNSLTNGCDCLGEIRYLDATLSDAAGEPYTIASAICVHEEDAGILYKHGEQVRRNRRLVISSVSTIGNYDYAFYWSLYRDGTIELEIRLTGIVLTRAVDPDEPLRHAARIAPSLAAPHHQHLFNVRLDMAVDGFENRVYEVDMVASEPGPDNPHGGATEQRETLIGRERDGRRRTDPLAGRTWKVASATGTAYKLVPHNGPLLLAHADSSVARRAGFARAHLWVTRYADGERHAAGDYPNQSPGGPGLEAFVAHDRELVDTNVVLWHTLGTSHAVRPEDWPLMPVERIGFALKPVGFFGHNPAL
jgi:primary-amine oxidase